MCWACAQPNIVTLGPGMLFETRGPQSTPRVDKALLLRLGWDKDEVLVFLLACAGSSSRCLLALDLPLKIVPLFAVLLDVRPLASLVLEKERKRGRFRLNVSTAGGGDVKETRGARIRMS